MCTCICICYIYLYFFSNGHLDVINYLIEKGCDPTVLRGYVTENGDQPALHLFTM